MLNYAHVMMSLLCGGLLASAAMAADAPKDPQQVCHVEKTVKRTLQCRYLMYLPPDYDKDKSVKWPVVIFLHAGGERGDNIEVLKTNGPTEMVEKGTVFPFILLSPQCPGDSSFDREADAIIAMLDQVEAKYRVDSKRVYLTGPSLGGFGTWAVASKYPERFAAIAPICGGGDPRKAAVLKDMPIWAFHGEKDDVVPLQRGQAMVDAVRAAGGNPKFTIHPGLGHVIWSRSYRNQEFWDWLLSQRHP